MLIVELIFIVGQLGLLYGAFWLGNKYHTLSALWADIKNRIFGVEKKEGT